MKDNRQIINQSYQRNLIHATVTNNIGINNKDRLVKAYGTTLDRIEVLRKLKSQSKFTLYWFSSFILIGALCLILDFEGCWFNIFDLYFVMINVYLVANGKLIGIYVGIAECFAYAFICYKTQLYGEVIKVLCISVPLNIYSIISWTKGIKKRKTEKYNDKKVEEDVVIKRMTTTNKIVCGVSLVIVSVACYFLLKYVLGQTTALIFSAIALAITIVGKILTAKQFMETYSVYIISDIICFGMWIETLVTIGFNFAAFSMLIYYLALALNDVNAFNLWKAMYRRVAVNGGYLFARRKIKVNKIIKLRRQYKNLIWDKKIDIAKNS